MSQFSSQQQQQEQNSNDFLLSTNVENNIMLV
jgi:hypothetical protein